MEGLISTLLPGVGAMANTHPLFVHFPIALLSSFLLLEFLHFVSGKDELRHAATWTLYLGALGAVAAVFAGLHAEGTLPHSKDLHDILIRHEQFGIVVASLAVVMALWRFFYSKRIFEKRGIWLLHLLLGALMVVIMTFGADLGGLMVYKFGAAVEAVPVEEGHDHAAGGHGQDGGEDAGVPNGIKPASAPDKAELPLSGFTPQSAGREGEVSDHHHGDDGGAPHSH